MGEGEKGGYRGEKRKKGEIGLPLYSGVDAQYIRGLYCPGVGIAVSL